MNLKNYYQYLFILLISFNSLKGYTQDLNPEAYKYLSIGDTFVIKDDFVLAEQQYYRAIEEGAILHSTIYYKLSFCYHQNFQDSLAKYYMVKAINQGLYFWSIEQVKQDKQLEYILQGDTVELNRLVNNSIQFRYSDSLCEYKELSTELLKRKKKDQKYRLVGNNSKQNWLTQQEIDAQNIEFLDSVLTGLGKWPGYSEVGEEGASAAALIAIHSLDTNFQRRVLEKMEVAISNENIFYGDYALLMDKYWMKVKGKQIFGTQITYDKELKKVTIENLMYPEYVDILRTYFTLIPLKDYVEHMEKVNAQ